MISFPLQLCLWCLHEYKNFSSLHCETFKSTYVFYQCIMKVACVHGYSIFASWNVHTCMYFIIAPWSLHEFMYSIFASWNLHEYRHSSFASWNLLEYMYSSFALWNLHECICFIFAPWSWHEYMHTLPVRYTSVHVCGACTLPFVRQGKKTILNSYILVILTGHIPLLWKKKNPTVCVACNVMLLSQSNLSL